jgi:hypothetical protein
LRGTGGGIPFAARRCQSLLPSNGANGPDPGALIAPLPVAAGTVDLEVLAEPAHAAVAAAPGDDDLGGAAAGCAAVGAVSLGWLGHGVADGL